jgi:hypothetical protein
MQGAGSVMPAYFSKLPAIGQGSLKFHDQWGQIFLEDGPKDIKINLVVTMDQAIPQTDYLYPWQLGM